MRALVLRLLTLLGLVLMPFGMGAASAAPAHHAPAAVTAGHCGEHGRQPEKQSPENAANCAISCSMLLAAEARIEDPDPPVCLPAACPLVDRRAGLHPDTATPPPKLS
jgi:hypothetical protein